MDKSPLVPNLALILSWNVTVPADESNNIVLLPAPILAVKVTSPPLFTFTLPLNVETPETVNPSSTTTVPPAESSVRLPVAVSISPSFEPLANISSPIRPEEKGCEASPR